MKRIIDLNENDIKRIVLKVLNEQEKNTFKDTIMALADTAKGSFQKFMDELQGKSTPETKQSVEKPESSTPSEKIEKKGNRIVISNPGVSTKSFPSNLQDKLRKIVPNYYDKFVSELRSIGIDPEIAARQLYSESGFNNDVIRCKRKSSAGAQGLAQFMPATWSAYGQGSPCDPEQALKAYTKFMGKLMSMFPNRVDLALAGYNWGPSRSVLKTALKNNIAFKDLKNKMPSEPFNYTASILQP